MKKHVSTIILVVLFIAGLSLLLYPTVANAWNSRHATKVVDSYTEQVAEMTDQEIEDLLAQARSFNQRLVSRGSFSGKLSASDEEEYYTLLGTKTSAISYIEIPSINVVLPIYHGTDDSVLEMGAGHLMGSSLPVGGESTHCVLSGHRGLPSARLFTDLDQLVEGDIFLLHTLNETLTYQVDQILIVEPDDVSALSIVPGEDLCTLVTCTPYGVNTQRLLVRGHRIENLPDDELQVSSDALQLDPVTVAPFAAVPLFLLMLFWIWKRGKKEEE